MVAWVDTPAGRRRAAGRGAIVVLAGVVAYAAGVFIWGPLKWVGGIVALLGTWTVAWAFVHPERPGLLPSLSAACMSKKHETCSGSDATEHSCRCACHRRSAVRDTQTS